MDTTITAEMIGHKTVDGVIIAVRPDVEFDGTVETRPWVEFDTGAIFYPCVMARGVCYAAYWENEHLPEDYGVFRGEK